MFASASLISSNGRLNVLSDRSIFQILFVIYTKKCGAGWVWVWGMGANITLKHWFWYFVFVWLNGLNRVETANWTINFTKPAGKGERKRSRSTMDQYINNKQTTKQPPSAPRPPTQKKRGREVGPGRAGVGGLHSHYDLAISFLITAPPGHRWHVMTQRLAPAASQGASAERQVICYLWGRANFPRPLPCQWFPGTASPWRPAGRYRQTRAPTDLDFGFGPRVSIACTYRPSALCSHWVRQDYT